MYWKLIISGLAFFCAVTTTAQPAWTWTELDTMPKPVSNNAVVNGQVAGIPYVFSFGGIDSTKNMGGIHQQAYRYNMFSGLWESIPPLPDTLGKIASAASEVNNIIYIMGGYHVLPASPWEVSSTRVHRYDPATNTYLSDGAPIPVPIDDHVQCVWRDSLIFLVTGWSNTGNTPAVQIYNPYTDSWVSGTSTPATNAYMAFGASGTIIGDTIYYNGGAQGFAFAGTNKLRKGIINPLDPTDVTWVLETDNPGDAGYRMASATHGNRVFWIGGAGDTYNYDGISYGSGSGVDPLNRILTYDALTEQWWEGTGASYGVMDLRGIAQIGPLDWVICGGMDSGQVVSNRAFLLSYDPVIASIGEPVSSLAFQLYPNPAANVTYLVGDEFREYGVYNLLGELVLSGVTEKNVTEISIAGLEAGTYYVQCTGQTRKLVVNR